jgi:succinyl-diaminopimelate desuccinylase
LTVTQSDMETLLDDDVPGIVGLTQRLVQIPSRGGMDDYRPVVNEVTRAMRLLRLEPKVIPLGDGYVGAMCDVEGARPGPHIVLDACLDTADIGDRSAWAGDPFSGRLDGESWLHGRGAADSKAAVALFLHLARRFAEQPDFAGRLTLLFDLDEHTGGFAGIKTYLDALDRQPDGVFIGYPGQDRIIIGGRGFWRARVTVYGRAEHSASRNQNPINAVTRAAELTRWLNTFSPGAPDPTLGLRPKVTVTSISGGQPGSYSVVPDVASLDVDVRLTPTFTAVHAEELIREGLAKLDADKRWPAPRPSSFEQVTESWPPFKLPDDHPLPTALIAGARAAGLDPQLAVAGPSNIGCLLSARGIPATAGFGVRYRNLHGTDEAIDTATIPAVYVAYREALRRLLVAQ